MDISKSKYVHFLSFLSEKLFVKMILLPPEGLLQDCLQSLWLEVSTVGSQWNNISSSTKDALEVMRPNLHSHDKQDSNWGKSKSPTCRSFQSFKVIIIINIISVVAKGEVDKKHRHLRLKAWVFTFSIVPEGLFIIHSFPYRIVHCSKRLSRPFSFLIFFSVFFASYFFLMAEFPMWKFYFLSHLDLKKKY